MSAPAVPLICEASVAYPTDVPSEKLTELIWLAVPIVSVTRVPSAWVMLR